MKAIAILATSSVWSLSAAQAPARVDFGRDIQPLLREHCVECHGPSQQMRGLRLFRRFTGTQSGPQMPPSGPLAEPKINL